MLELLDDEPFEAVQEIIPDDPMYVFAPDRYFEAGRQALRCIRLALLCGELDEPRHIFDFASGADRVMRYMEHAWSTQDVVACRKPAAAGLSVR